MNTPNPNQALIDEVNAFMQRVEKLHPHAENGNRTGLNPNISVAVGGLHTCRDNLTWHGIGQLEAQAKAAEAATKVAAEKPASAEEPAPSEAQQ